MEKIDFAIAPAIDKKHHNKVVKIGRIQISTADRTRNEDTQVIKKGHLNEPELIIKLIERFITDKPK